MGAASPFAETRGRGFLRAHARLALPFSFVVKPCCHPRRSFQPITEGVHFWTVGSPRRRGWFALGDKVHLNVHDEGKKRVFSV